jgi:hypothetical protein
MTGGAKLVSSAYYIRLLRRKDCSSFIGEHREILPRQIKLAISPPWFPAASYARLELQPAVREEGLP